MKSWVQSLILWAPGPVLMSEHFRGARFDKQEQIWPAIMHKKCEMLNSHMGAEHTKTPELLSCLPCSPVHIGSLPAHLSQLLPVARPHDVLEPAGKLLM